MANERNYIAIVELEEDSALREQWPFSGVCDDCIAWPCYEDCAINKFPMSRQEAIERMAKALIRADYPHAQEVIWDMRWKEEASKDYYLIMAEAALNALLEATNASKN